MLGEALRLIRVYHDMKQTEAAGKLGISKSYLSEIEKGIKAPSLDIIKKYEAVFNIPSSSIIFFSEKIEDGTLGQGTRSFVADKVIRMLQFLEKKAG